MCMSLIYTSNVSRKYSTMEKSTITVFQTTYTYGVLFFIIFLSLKNGQILGCYVGCICQDRGVSFLASIDPKVLVTNCFRPLMLHSVWSVVVSQHD